jgi:fucose permease
MTQTIAHESRNMAIVKTLTYLMFAMFAMTTDSVGLIIPEIIKAFQLSLTAAGTFQYATMAGIAFAGLVLGQLADRFGRRRTIVAGLTLFAAACFLLSAGHSFLFFAVMLGLSGLAIGVFKTGALALIGDISTSTAQHTSIMNTAEGFFGVGAIIGPAILARLLTAGLSWTWLYAIAGTICVALIGLALVVKYPETTTPSGDSGFQRHRPRDEEPVRAGVLRRGFPVCWRRSRGLRVDADTARRLRRLGGRPRDLQHLDLLRVARRRAFPRRLDADARPVAVGAHAVQRLHPPVFQRQRRRRREPGRCICSHCPDCSCRSSIPRSIRRASAAFPKSEHGAGAGVILFFTCASAVLAPLAIGAVSDAFGRIEYGFSLATGFAALLFIGSLLNWLLNPTRLVLEQRDVTEYRQDATA